MRLISSFLGVNTGKCLDKIIDLDLDISKKLEGKLQTLAKTSKCGFYFAQPILNPQYLREPELCRIHTEESGLAEKQNSFS